MKLKAGDVLIEVRRGGRRTERTVTKVGRRWAETLNGRVSVEPDASGFIYCPDTHTSDAEVYVSHYAADVAAWKSGALAAVRKGIEWTYSSKFSVETLESALTLFGIEHEPAPKVTP